MHARMHACNHVRACSRAYIGRFITGEVRHLPKVYECCCVFRRVLMQIVVAARDGRALYRTITGNDSSKKKGEIEGNQPCDLLLSARKRSMRL